MRPLDPRLLRRARAARVLLAVDVAIGLATALFVLLQATLLARVVARSFDGASLDEVSGALVLLAFVFAGRAVLAWGFEVAGRLAATGVLSQLRLELVERRLRREPASLDGTQSGEIAAVAVQESTRSRPTSGGSSRSSCSRSRLVAVIAWVVPIDLTSAALMLLTLPLVPVFMVLIGRYTERDTHALACPLPPLDALPRRRARSPDAPGVQSRTRSDRGDRRNERAVPQHDHEDLRVAFLSGAVLELAATLGVALVAVTVGVRLADGGIGFESALTILVLAPELYLPLRNLGAVPRECGRARGGRAPARAHGGIDDH